MAEGEGSDRLKAAGITPTSYTQLADVARSGIARLDVLGIRWQNTRFQRYVEFLTDATQRTYPRRIDWNANRSELLHELEAIGQCVQLACATSLLGVLDRELLIERLRDCLSGGDLPADDDRPRNTLLELTTAYLLAKQGFGVELTTAREDLVLRIPGAPPMPVECKRPGSPDTVARNVKRARRQLQDHLDRYPDGGVVVVGLDRVAGMSGELARIRAASELPDLVTTILNEGAINIMRLDNPKLLKAARVVMTVMVGAVFLTDPTQPVGVLRTTWAPVPAVHGRQALRDLLLASFRTDVRLTLESLIA